MLFTLNLLKWSRLGWLVWWLLRRPNSMSLVPSVTDIIITVIIIRIIILIMITTMSVFLERLSMLNMLSCAEQVQIQQYETHAHKTLKTAGVQTIMLKHPTKQLKKILGQLHVLPR